MAASAELAALREFQLASVTGLKKLKVIFIVAVRAEVVAVVSTVEHDDVLMFIGDDEDMVGIES